MSRAVVALGSLAGVLPANNMSLAEAGIYVCTSIRPARAEIYLLTPDPLEIRGSGQGQ